MSQSYEQDIDRLDRDIKNLRIEYERFFSGAVAVPPESLRDKIQTEIRRLRNAQTSSAEQFRLGSLEARFNSYGDLYQRRLRDQEEGRSRRRIPAEPSERLDPRHGVVVGETVEPEAVEALYQGLHRGSGPGPRFDQHSFQVYLEKQAATIREQTGAQRVQFRLAEEKGKMKLKAKPVQQRRVDSEKGAS